MKLNTALLCLITIFIFGCTNPSTETSDAYDLVNPFIGTGGHGHTYPGATLPFGMVQLSPDARLDGWDGCSGYHYTDSVIYGFSHTHLSGTGVSDYGDILLMPRQGENNYDNGYKSGDPAGYGSPFQKDSERAKPGLYQVHLDENNIDVRLTSTKRVGIHEYTFLNDAAPKVLLDLSHRDKLLDFQIEMTNDKEIIGKRISEAWATNQHIYYVIQFSEKIVKQAFDETKTRAYFEFGSDKKKILVKVGISAVSIDGARKNLEAEAKHWDFDKYLAAAKSEWQRELNKIQVRDADFDKKSIFYSALYHTLIVPNTFSDVDGSYRGMDQQIHQAKDETMYTIFSLWDTFRATHPLYTITQQKKTNEFIRTFLKQYQDGGELPIWELAGNYTGCMIGYHGVSVIADAHAKGIRDYDEELALTAMLKSANNDKLGLEAYKAKQYIAAGDEAESVSKTLEYAYDDWCIAQMASALGKEKVANTFLDRSQYYKNIINPENGFVQAKMNGAWTSNFDPAEVNFNYTEANSWQYSLFAPHDVTGLILMHGGNEGLDKKLDQLFTTEMELSGRHQVDITGLIGQYAHGNEPSHHMAYLYNYIGKPWKTQKYVAKILKEQYRNQPDGLSGNEDCGQMSAWYILSSMGFYSVTPGMDYYAIGTPHFDSAIIDLESGKSFEIMAKNLSDKNIYIQSATLNGEVFNQGYLKHQSILNGGKLVFEMGSAPNKNWGVKDIPVAKIKDNNDYIPVPYFSASSQTFEESMNITIVGIESDLDIYYSLNGQDYLPYNRPILIEKDANIQAYASKNNKKSVHVTASYKKIKGGRSIRLESEYSNQYAAGGNKGLIDRLKGSSNFRTGYWQGYYGTDFSAVVDLGEVENVNLISVGCLQDIKSWIWFPKNVIIETSTNGKAFSEVANITNDFSSEEYGAFLKEFSQKFSSPKRIRFIRVKATNFGPCPKWHLGDGNDTWLFLDEITVE